MSTRQGRVQDIYVLSIALASITFDHDPGSIGAVSIRRNATEAVTVPEWRPGVVRPEDSQAAYAIRDVGDGPVAIRVGLSSDQGAGEEVTVRAVDPMLDALPADADDATRLALRRRLGNVLGEVAARRVSVPADGALELFSLRRHQLARRGVGVNTVDWRWELQSPGDEHWHAFAQTTHRVYSVLEAPSAPWASPLAGDDTQLPWTDVLEYACRWAASTQTTDAAATRVTAAVFELGPRFVEYGCPVGAATQYAWPYFFCTELIARLRGGAGRGRYVNCTDCATIVSTFANSLGCDLWQSRMFGPAPFDLNPTIAIGGAGWTTACGWPAFNYHEVAWTGACTASDEVYDGCVLVDGDADPTQDPHAAMLAVKLRFGEPGEGSYRDRLAAPAGRGNCEAHPSTRRRRVVV